MDIENLTDATARALFWNDTEDIKRILRQGTSANVIIGPITSDNPRYGANIIMLDPEYQDFDWFSSDGDTLGNILLHPAVIRSDYELIKLLLDNGAHLTNADEEERTALHIACEISSLEIIKLLIEESPPYIFELTDVYRRTPLDYACQFNCPDVVRFLLSRGCSVGANDQNRFPVWCAVCNEVAEYRTSIVSLLIETGANINRGPHWKTTPLIQALYRICFYDLDSYIDISILLIELGCDVNIADEDGRTALLFAVEKELENVVRKLLISGSDIDNWVFYRNTPLRVACRIGSRRLVDLLITCGANLRALDPKHTLKRWQRSGQLNERNTQLLNYVIDESKKCLTLESLCNITIRKNIRNVEKDASQLGLPPLLVKRLQLKDWCKSVM